MSMATRSVRMPSGITVEMTKAMVWLHEGCPDARKHDPLPKDFNPATGYSKTRRQAKCATCGLWMKWEPKQR